MTRSLCLSNGLSVKYRTSVQHRSPKANGRALCPYTANLTVNGDEHDGRERRQSTSDNEGAVEFVDVSVELASGAADSKLPCICLATATVGREFIFATKHFSRRRSAHLFGVCAANLVASSRRFVECSELESQLDHSSIQPQCRHVGTRSRRVTFVLISFHETGQAFEIHTCRSRKSSPSLPIQRPNVG